jgi:hypothetical protein
MRSETARRLDWLVWKGRASIALAIALGLVVFGARYAYVNWPDPVVETRIVSGTVTNWMREQTDQGAGALVVWVSLDDGRDVMTRQLPVDGPQRGPAVIEERRHRSGQISFRWVKSKLD